jgi:hypothetical protein
LILSQHLAGQESYNQLNETGNRIGLWREFHPNGKLKQVQSYETPKKLHVTEKSVAFQLGLRSDSCCDTILYKDNLLLSDYYEYDDNWIFYRVRRVADSDKPIYLYGSAQEIGRIEDESRFISGRISEEAEVVLSLVNFSSKSISLTSKNEYENIGFLPDNLVLTKNDTTSIKVRIGIKPRESKYEIAFNYHEATINLIIITYGYHITSNDLQASERVKVNGDVLIYYRTENESLVEIYDDSKSTVLQTNSLALKKTEIDLAALQSGKYWLKIFDFSADKYHWLLLDIKK